MLSLGAAPLGLGEPSGPRDGRARAGNGRELFLLVLRGLCPGFFDLLLVLGLLLPLLLGLLSGLLLWLAPWAGPRGGLLHGSEWWWGRRRLLLLLVC